MGELPVAKENGVVPMLNGMGVAGVVFCPKEIEEGKPPLAKAVPEEDAKVCEKPA